MTGFHPEDRIYLQQCQKRCGIIDEIRPLPLATPLSRAEAIQWNNEFERLMRNRLIVGSIRYGGVNHNDLSNLDYMSSIRRRLRAFESDINLEHLVDIANLCMVVFANPPAGAVFHGQDENGEHVGEWNERL